MRVDDLELIEACTRGDNDAWRSFLDQYEDFIRFIIRKSLTKARDHEVDDLHDEIVAWLYDRNGRVLATYRGESKLTSWLGVVIGRQVRRMMKRKMEQEEGLVSLDAMTLNTGSELAKAGKIDRVGFDPRAIDKLREAIAELGERDRALITGAFLQNRNYEELAEELGVKESSVGQLLFRAKARLKELLGGENFLESLSGFALALLYFFGTALF